MEAVARHRGRREALLLLVLCLVLGSTIRAGEPPLRVAVASNFLATAKTIRQHCDPDRNRIHISAASTGTLFAQIRHGAPYDVFLAADARRPRLLEQQGLAERGSRFTYARGILVLWSADPKLLATGPAPLRNHAIQPLAIANPATAPYGEAARQVLSKLRLWDAYQGHLVRGENVSQTLHFAHRGGAQAAFVALAQILALPAAERGSHWTVPTRFYAPIEQQAVLLSNSQQRSRAQTFLKCLRSADARAVIADHGYDLPESVSSDVLRTTAVRIKQHCCP